MRLSLLSAVVIGILAGVVVCVGVLFNERVIKVDDPWRYFRAWLLWMAGSGLRWHFADGTYGASWNGVGAASYLGAAGQGVTGLLRRQTPVCQPVVWRYTMRGLGIWSDVWCLLGR